MLASRLLPPRPRSRALLPRALRLLWTLPTNLVGHLAGFLASGGRAPRRVGGRAGRGWLYPIRRGLGLDWVGAVTLGNAILHRAGMFDGARGRLVLAHELAHTRQHDWLGPLYLPVHALAQATSALICVARRRPPSVSHVHDWNPLEQTFICVAAGLTPDEARAALGAEGLDRLYADFGV